MVKLRGINVYPTAIGAMVDQLPSANGEYLCVLTRSGGRDELCVEVEWNGNATEPERQAVADVLNKGLGVKVDVALVAPESTADRTGVNVRQKPQRLLDERQD